MCCLRARTILITYMVTRYKIALVQISIYDIFFHFIYYLIYLCICLINSIDSYLLLSVYIYKSFCLKVQF